MLSLDDDDDDDVIYSHPSCFVLLYFFLPSDRGITDLVDREKAAADKLAAATAGDVPIVKKKKKPKMSLGESFKYLITNKYLGCMAILVVSYGLSINFTEVRPLS